MNRVPLAYYFTPEGQTAALESYSRFADQNGWPVSEKVRLYVESREAFGPDAKDQDVRRRAFDNIYSSLSSRAWQAFRSSKPGPKWSRRKVLRNLHQKLAGLSWGDGLSLTNALDPKQQSDMKIGLDSMRGIKAKSGYPLMTVSKFLHFFNPSLFPIYDGAIFERRVLKRFEKDYEQFCASGSLDANSSGAEFYINYVSWAGSLIRGADRQFMIAFVDWMQDELSPRYFRWLARETYGSLYAAAFEYVAIGTAELKN